MFESHQNYLIFWVFLLNHKYFLFISIIFQIFEFARQKWTKLSNYTFWGIFKQCGFRERILLLLLGKKIFSIFAPWQLSLTCVFQLCFTWRHETSWDTQFFIPSQGFHCVSFIPKRKSLSSLINVACYYSNNEKVLRPICKVLRLRSWEFLPNNGSYCSLEN